MSDYNKETDMVEVYATAKQIEELNKIIIDLRKQIVYLESQVDGYEKVPMPRTVVDQIIQLKSENEKLRDDIKFYQKHVSPSVIINRENKKKPTRRGGIPK